MFSGMMAHMANPDVKKAVLTYVECAKSIGRRISWQGNFVQIVSWWYECCFTITSIKAKQDVPRGPH